MDLFINLTPCTKGTTRTLIPNSVRTHTILTIVVTFTLVTSDVFDTCGLRTLLFTLLYYWKSLSPICENSSQSYLFLLLIHGRVKTVEGSCDILMNTRISI